MKKRFYSLVLCVILGLFFLPGIKAQSVNTTTTITWPFDLGIAGQVATYSDATGDYFKPDHVGNGSKINYVDINTTFGVTYTRFQPTEQLGSADAAGMISFNVWPKTGLSFTPSAISFDCMRFGTDGGFVDVVWKSSDGTSTTLQAGLKPNRNNDVSGTGTHATYDLSGLSIPASDGECSLELYVYGFANTKQVGFANIVFTGSIEGTVVNIPTYTITTSVSPENSGTIVSSPVGNEFDEGTEIILTANRNFGYNFSHWANELNEIVSTENPDTFTLMANTTLKAVFSVLNTYSLEINVDGGAADYMVTPLPAGTFVEGVRMYEEGTNVTLTAGNNPILNFTNWGTGETSSDLVVSMDANKEVTANYSAVDYIVGWDFYRTGSSGRVADFFSTTDNESAALIMRDSSGTAKGWLDKSQLAAGGYEGRAAAVNWQPLVNKYYYQISFVATDFTDIKISAAMLYNYNAYSIQQCEYSLDGTNFIQLGTYNMSAAKVWYDQIFNLPMEADHAAKVYIRWIPDYTSAIVGTTSSNDGTAISGIYVTATATIFNDGVAPVLQSSVPAEGATGASATGKIVLSFDEKVKIAEGTTVTLGEKVLEPLVSGKTITFAYTGLEYNTGYTFALSGNTVSDLADNTLTDAISINFTTMNRPTVTKKLFDFVVGVDGDFKAALAAAQTASSSGNRFYVFFPDGEYNIGSNTGDANEMTTVSIPNVSYIGESSHGVILYNQNTTEGIGSTATLKFTNTSSNLYLQDLTLRNKDFRSGTASLGRCVALQDNGDKNIYKNVKIQSNQDTYYTGGSRTYLENCDIHGTVDYICGGGDLFFNECLLYLEDRSGNCLTAPATSSQWGYVFNNCTIDGFAVNSGSYRLGRSWSNAPKAVYINTIMKVLPTAEAWGDPMNVVPSVFAEYNSMTSSGATVDLSSRRTTYTKDLTTVVLEPVLSDAQAATYTVENVLGGSDTWQPRLYTEQAEAPVIEGNASAITWDDSNYVLCWAVCKDGAFVEFTTTNSYVIPEGTLNGSVYTVRAANEMGGLGAVSNQYVYLTSGVDNVNFTPQVVDNQFYTIDGKRLITIEHYVGIVIVHTVYSNGRVEISKELKKGY
ncbi:MAG: Ig-like domain-containing protein [Marinilabiliaceae bacterium]|nr:Ig-like domain-containing protein [Marinilabiliaceae bacterium]